MISRITGLLIDVKEQAAIVSLNGLCYEVLIPANLRARLRHLVDTTEGTPEVTLYTWYYLEGGPSLGRQLPRLVGFLSESEREFFSLYTTVKGLGVRKGLRSLTLPVREIALAIERGEKSKLNALPEIGSRTAEKIIAELRGKLARWALIKPEERVPVEEPEADFTAEAREVLLQLQYKPAEAEKIIKGAIASNPAIASCEELIQEIFRQQAKNL